MSVTFRRSASSFSRVRVLIHTPHHLQMAASELGYNPPPDYEAIDKESLIDLSSIDPNKELWLLQCPKDQFPDDFNGQEISLNLNGGDGTFATFVTPSGKSYELASFASQEPDATVFQYSKTGSKVVGKISRRVSLIHYPEPSEQDESNLHQSTKFFQRSAATSSMGPSRRSRHTSSSGLTQSTVTPSRVSKQTTSLFEFELGESSKRSKKNHYTQGMEQSDVSSLGSAGKSRGEAKKIKHEM